MNAVKIDRSFVSQAGQSEYHRVLIDATLRVARALGLGTVAEGIETKEDRDCLAAEGCKEGQGYYFGYAQPQSEVLKLLSMGKVRDVA